MKKLENDGHLLSVWDVEAAADWVWSRVLPGVYDQLVNVRGWSHEEVVSRTVASLEAELLERN